jgi:hypothetical protein
MKNLAFAIATLIGIGGAVGVLAPAELVWIAQRSASSSAFYLIAAVRVAFGLVLISVAPASRAPRPLRVLGYLIVVAGLATALTALVAMARAVAIIEWWLHQGSGWLRLAALFVLVLGGFVAYACAPGVGVSRSRTPEAGH